DEPNYPNSFGANNDQHVAYSPITMDSATSPDSRSVSFTYDIGEADPGRRFTVGIYRSASPKFDPTTAVMLTQQSLPTLDTSSHDRLAIGNHTVVIGPGNALKTDPQHEYIFVVADPSHTIGLNDGTFEEAHFWTFVLGALAHGLSPLGGASGLPAWETS